MATDLFVKQLDGCSYASGGLNCTAASTAMLLYRASRGRVKRTSCQIRSQTGDTSGGLNLDQMKQLLSARYGIETRLYRPISQKSLLLINRSGYPVVEQVGYRPIAATDHDCFRHSFTGGHAIFVSYATSSWAKVGDPGADGRYRGCPDGFQHYGLSLLATALDALPLGRGTLGSEAGPGHAYALVGPKDPVTYRVATARGRIFNKVWGTRVIEEFPKGTRFIRLGRAHDRTGRTWFRVRHPETGHQGYVKGWITRAE